MSERVKFVGIDSWNRPIFKSLDKPRHYYGSVHALFDYEAKEAEVLAKIDESDLTYFGSRFGCEPYGVWVEDLKIVKEKEDVKAS